MSKEELELKLSILAWGILINIILNISVLILK
jgi:hypothetical protein